MTELPRGAVTFLFSDIEGSTRLVKTLRERYAQVLAEHRSLVRAAIARQGGHEIDTQGDAFFVAFASAKQAVLCALEVQRVLAAHEWPSGVSVRVRMGIHTGQATPVGGAYMGLAVHRAARICAAARGGQVLVSQATQTLIEDEEEDLGFALAELGERRLKDLNRPVRLFELTVTDAVPEPPARNTAPGPAPAPIVGRAAELRIVSDAYARVMTGQPQVMLITGKAGIGKTRLVEELTGLVLSGAEGARVCVGESAPVAGAALAYGPFVAALGNEAGWLLADDREGNMLAARHRLFVRVFELLASLAARSPLVVVLEDLHWADESSRELLTFLAVRLRTERVMIVGTLREELTNSVRRWLTELEHRPRVTRLRLGPMVDTELAVLVAGAMPAGTSPDRVATVVAAADGNPLFAKELASTEPGGSPASITDAVLAKASALTPHAQAVVDQISVADGGMPHELLAATVKLSEARLLAAARAGVESGLLAPTGDGYSFTHALIRQVIYTQTLPSKRCLLHRRLAEVLADRPGSDPGLLARHWQLAGRPDQAAVAALLAARRAVSVRAYPEAAKNYGLAIELMNWLPEAGPDLLEEAARSASWAGDPKQAAAWAADALARGGVAAPMDRARRLERLGRYRWETGDPKAALDAAEQAVVILDPEPPSELQARVLAALATWRVLLGEADAALPLVTKAMEVAQHAGAGRRVRARPGHAGDHRSAVWRPGGRPGRSAGGVHAGLPRRQRRGRDSRRGEPRSPAVPRRPFRRGGRGRPRGPKRGGRHGRAAGDHHRDRQQCRGRAARERPVDARPISCWPTWWPNRRTNFTRYLQLLQLELAVGRGESRARCRPGRHAAEVPGRSPARRVRCTPAWPSRHSGADDLAAAAARGDRRTGGAVRCRDGRGRAPAASRRLAARRRSGLAARALTRLGKSRSDGTN